VAHPQERRLTMSNPNRDNRSGMSCADPPSWPSMPRIVKSPNCYEKQLQMSKAGLYTDMEVRCLDDSGATCDKISFHVHVVIICSMSYYFQSMMSLNGISGCDPHKYNEKGEVIVDLNDIPASAFAAIRDFMYTGRGCEKMEDVSGVLLGADFLRIEQLF